MIFFKKQDILSNRLQIKTKICNPNYLNNLDNSLLIIAVFHTTVSKDFTAETRLAFAAKQ